MSSGVPAPVLLGKIKKRFDIYLPDDCDQLLEECVCPFNHYLICPELTER